MKIDFMRENNALRNSELWNPVEIQIFLLRFESKIEASVIILLEDFNLQHNLQIELCS